MVGSVPTILMPGADGSNPILHRSIGGSVLPFRYLISVSDMTQTSHHPRRYFELQRS